MLKRRRKDIDNYIENKNKLNMDNKKTKYNLRNKLNNESNDELNNESSNELNNLHSIHNFYKIFLPKFIENLELYRKKIRKITKKLILESNSEDINNIFNSEFKYHTKSRDSNDSEKLNYFDIKEYSSNSPFNNSCNALFHWAPIADELKELDKEVVINSIKNKWMLVVADLERIPINLK